MRRAGTAARGHLAAGPGRGDPKRRAGAVATGHLAPGLVRAYSMRRASAAARGHLVTGFVNADFMRWAGASAPGHLTPGLGCANLMRRAGADSPSHLVPGLGRADPMFQSRCRYGRLPFPRLRQHPNKLAVLYHQWQVMSRSAEQLIFWFFWFHRQFHDSIPLLFCFVLRKSV